MTLVSSFDGDDVARLVPRNRRDKPANRGQPRLRTIWISDVHLGTQGCKAEALRDFLRNNECDLLYLVGDIVDGWRLSQRWYWPASHRAVIDEILAKVQAGTRVIYIPGNHDEVFRGYAGMCFAGVEVATEVVHETAAGLRLLVLHGDQFDGVVTHARWLARVGDWAHAGAVRANSVLAAFRRGLGLPYWSLSRWLKDHVKDAVEFIARFEDALAAEARRRRLDGVVCGHIHKAEIRRVGEIIYCNDGDWVESCTALTEDEAGNLSILEWDRTQMRPAARVPAVYAAAAE